jgi:hypothetical protein
MGEPDPIRPEPGPDADIDELQTDIQQTRKELGQTVEALTAKMDVKERTKQKAAETKERVLDKAHAVQHATLEDGRAKRTVPVAAVIVVGAAVAWILWRRRR